VLDSNQRHRG